MKLLKTGLRSEVYDLGDGKFLKLYNGWVSAELVDYEINVSQAAFEAGIPCARVYETVEIGYRQGIVFEFVEGPDLRHQLMDRPWTIRRYGIEMARLQALVHGNKLSGLRSQQAHIVSAIQASYSVLKPYWNKIMDCLELVSDGPVCLCHGDFSVENMIVSRNGLMLIDWADAYAGNPLSDVARAWILIHTPYRDGEFPAWTKGFSGASKKWLFYNYLQEYLKITGKKKAQYQVWRVPMAAARLKEEVPREKVWLLNIIKNASVKI